MTYIRYVSKRMLPYTSTYVEKPYNAEYTNPLETHDDA